MFILGILAFSQVVFLPGIIILKFLPNRWRVIPTIVFSFGLSLLANYVLVSVLTALNLYVRPVLISIYVLELILAVYLYKPQLSLPIEDIARKFYLALEELAHSFISPNSEEDRKGFLVRVVLLLVTIVFIGYAFSNLVWGLKIWWNGIGSVIDRWDAVVSWNRWAVEWSANQFPTGTWEYPQLIPTNLSISYVFMGNPQIQFFNTAFLSLFLFLILLLLFDLALQYRSVGYFIGIIAAKFILKEFTWQYFNTAYVDIPLAFLAFAAIFSVLEAQKQHDLDQKKGYIWIGLLLAAATAVTKQGGLYLLVLTPLMIYFFVLSSAEKTQSSQAKLRLFWGPLLGALLVTLPWYIYVEVGIAQGTIESNIEWVAQGIHGNLTYWERFVAAFHSLGIYAYTLPLVVIGGFWLKKSAKWIVFGIIFPYYIAWAFFFSYSPRNLSLIFPFWALAFGLFSEKILDLIAEFIHRLRLQQLRMVIVPILSVVLILIVSVFMSNEKLITRQTDLQKHILDERLNIFLYEYFDELGRVEPIITTYPVGELPGLQQVMISFADQEFFNQKWEEYPDVNLLLMPSSADENLKSQIFEKVDRGEYELLFHEQNYNYYFIRRLSP